MKNLLLASLLLASGSAMADDQDAPCRIPFEKAMNFNPSNPGSTFPFKAGSETNSNTALAAHLRGRYIVADLNTTDENGSCKGVNEVFTPTEELSDFSNLKKLADLTGLSVSAISGMNSAALSDALRANAAGKPPAALREAEGLIRDKAAVLATEVDDYRNFQKNVEGYRTAPISKAPVVSGSLHGTSMNFCVGQTLNYCEVVDGAPKLVYRFITSSSKAIPPSHQYYAPINTIATRHWSSDRKYGSDDAARDTRLGGGDGRAIPFANGGHPIEMPNFLNFLPADGYAGERNNGIHEIAGGLDSGGTFGAPVSLGCLRLNDFQSKLSRWFTPHNAKLFIYFEGSRYKQSGNVNTKRGI